MFFIATAAFIKGINKEKPSGIIPKGLSFAWQRPTLPEPCGSSTLGAGGLNGRVRDGNAWFPSAIITKRCASCTFRVYSLKTRNEAKQVKHPGNTLLLSHDCE
jgi:hypothetical protein